MMSKWSDVWGQVSQAVKASSSSSDACARVSRIRGRDTTWQAISREWRRKKEEGVESASAWDSMNSPGRASGAGATTWKHVVIADTQVKPGVPLHHFPALARLIMEEDPDVIVHLGDHWDMPSLSSYESTAKKARTGRLVKADISSGNKALEMMENVWSRAGYTPNRKVLLEGNHDGFAPEGRVGRYIAEHPHHEGMIALDEFADSWLGWERHPFLKPVDIDGVIYCHLFPINAQGRSTMAGQRTGAGSADVQIKGMLQSCTAGHKQGLDTKMRYSPNGAVLRGVIAGSCYLHDESYMGMANRSHWRGLLIKHNVGQDNPNHYDLEEMSMYRLLKTYGGK